MPWHLAQKGDDIAHEHHVIDDLAQEKNPNKGDGPEQIVSS